MPRVRKPKPHGESVIPKAVLAKAIADILDEEELTQTEAAWMLRDSPSQLSLIVSGKLRGFSAERLLRMLTGLGKDVEVVVRKAKGNAGGRVRAIVK